MDSQAAVMLSALRRLLVGMAAAFFCFGRPVHAQQELLVIYNDRLPYWSTDASGRPTGWFNGVMRDVLAKAGLAGKWVELPPGRILGDLMDGLPACSPLWYWTEERAARLWYSVPGYRHAVVSIYVKRSRLEEFRAYARIEDVFNIERYNAVIQHGLNYGGLEPYIVASRSTINRVSVRVAEILRMLDAGRVDFMFIQPEEFDMIAAQAGFSPESFVRLSFDQAFPEQLRYVICSRTVPEEIRDRINAAVAEIGLLNLEQVRARYGR